MNSLIIEAIATPVIGFSGSRSEVPEQLTKLLKLISASSVILVGDAKGVDQAVREAVPMAEVFTVKFKGRGGFAARSIEMVKALAKERGTLFSFPSRPCPDGLKPSKSAFSGKGSGTWATLAYAIALDVEAIVYLGDLPSPGPGWSLEDIGGGWVKFSPSVQLSLF